MAHLARPAYQSVARRALRYLSPPERPWAPRPCPLPCPCAHTAAPFHLDLPSSCTRLCVRILVLVVATLFSVFAGCSGSFHARKICYHHDIIFSHLCFLLSPSSSSSSYLPYSFFSDLSSSPPPLITLIHPLPLPSLFPILLLCPAFPCSPPSRSPVLPASETWKRPIC